MKKVLSIFILSIFVLSFSDVSAAFAVTQEQMMAKMEMLEKQLTEVKSELADMKKNRMQAVAAVRKDAPAGKFSALPDIQFYGFLKTDFAYDDSRMNNPDHPGFVMSEAGIDDDHQFTATAQNTRFGINMTGPELWDGQVKGKAEIDFLDSTSDNSFKPRIRHLYIDLVFPGWSLLFGQTWDIIGPLGPATLNTNGWLWRAGNIGFRRTQARLTNKFELSDYDSLTTQIGVFRNIGTGNGTVNTGEDSGWPLIQARVSVATTRLFDRKLEIGIAGLYAEEEVDRTPATTTDTWKAKEYGLVLDAVIPLYESITLKGEAFWGKNLDEFLAGIGQGVNVATERAIEAYGGWGQISYKATDEITLNSGYGIDHCEKNDLSAGMRETNQVVFANVIYSPIKNVKFGIEYSHWYTQYLGVDNGENNRVQGSVIWSF